jgi:hypothetical protein
VPLSSRTLLTSAYRTRLYKEIFQIKLLAVPFIEAKRCIVSSRPSAMASNSRAQGGALLPVGVLQWDLLFPMFIQYKPTEIKPTHNDRRRWVLDGF